MRLNGSPFTVVGVAAPDFDGTNAGLITQMWAPVTARTTLDTGWAEELRNERSAWFYLTGRLKPGVTIDRAQAAFRVLHDQVKQEELTSEFFAKFPDTRERFLRQAMQLIPADKGLSSIRRAFERPLVVLQWLVGVVLLIPCTNLVVFDVRMLDDQLDMRLANERLLSVLSSGFALLATLLAIVGLHGALAFVVARRTREIGIRLALGARRGAVMQLVMREMVVVVLVGLVAGLAAAYLAGSYVEAQLFGVRAADWPVFAVSVVTLGAASLAGAFLLAWRASRISPLLALRAE